MTKFSNLMVDLETLGVSSGSAIVQIGLWAFNANAMAESGRRIKVWPNKNMKVDFETIQFWMGQPDLVRNMVVVNNEDRLTEKEAIWGITQYLQDNCTQEFTLWALPSVFDVPLLEAMYDRNNTSYPWAHWRVKCARTLFDAHGISKAARVQPEVAHDALFDAKAQAETMVKYGLLK